MNPKRLLVSFMLIVVALAVHRFSTIFRMAFTTRTAAATEHGSIEQKQSSSLVVTRDDKLQQQQQQQQQHDRYAYAFVVGGCNPETPTYRNYIYDILISTYLLREDGARSDVVALFQIHSQSNATRLPEEEVRWLHDMNIKVYYIPKNDGNNNAAAHDTFYSVSLQKFRILGLTQYRKILFLDSDVIPLGNLDYIFALSKNLKDNIIFPAIGSPANAGFFVLTPYDTALSDVTEIIQNKEEREEETMASSLSSSSSSFDPIVGWGHTIQPPDRWEKLKGRKFRNGLFAATSGTNWTFIGALADQGLLYHYTKYFRKQVSIVFGSRVQNWSPGPDGSSVQLEDIIENPYLASPSPKYRGLVSNCDAFSPIDDERDCPPPMCDYQHFISKLKPWRRGPPKHVSADTKNKTARHLWFYTLSILNAQLNMNLADPVRHWTITKEMAPLGAGPLPEQSRRSGIDLVKDRLVEA